MSERNSYLAIIPARKGSKRLPGKNLLNISGKPLIAWTIEAARQSGVFDRIMVSTDDNEIARVAEKYGAEVPCLRPPELSGDEATTADVIEYCLKKMNVPDQDYFSHLACLQPTSPLRSADDIRLAVEMLEGKNADAVISVCRNEHSPLWSNTLPPDFNMSNFLEKNIQKTPSQKLPDYYRLNGAIYLCDVKRFLEEKSLFLPDNIYAYIMSRKSSIDIDDDIDFELASIYLSRN
jgi:CMP-N-acetylneuraminic acid synthetase